MIKSNLPRTKGRKNRSSRLSDLRGLYYCVIIRRIRSNASDIRHTCIVAKPKPFRTVYRNTVMVMVAVARRVIRHSSFPFKRQGTASVVSHSKSVKYGNSIWKTLFKESTTLANIHCCPAFLLYLFTSKFDVCH